MAPSSSSFSNWSCVALTHSAPGLNHMLHKVGAQKETHQPLGYVLQAKASPPLSLQVLLLVK